MPVRRHPTTSPNAPQVYGAFVAGELTVTTPPQFAGKAPAAFVIDEIGAEVAVAPTGASLLVTIQYDNHDEAGSGFITIAQITIAAGTTAATVVTGFTNKNPKKGSKFKAVIDQIGSTLPGEDLSWYVKGK